VRATLQAGESEAIDVLDLEVIDLSEPRRGGLDAIADFRTFEERYATLAFGLGTVPRRQHAVEPLWQTPAGVLAAVGAVLALLTLVSTAH
jgi:hypothetical protein